MAAGLFCGLAVVPVFPVLWGALLGEIPHWDHVAAFLLPRFFLNTLYVSAGVLALTLVFGVGGAWLLARYRLPFKNLFRIGLMLPIAVPAYLGAFAWGNWFPDLTGLFACIVVMGLSLTPYVFATLYPVFAGGMGNRLEAAESLGYRGFRLLVFAALPMVRPLLAGSLSLVLMETLNEYGAPSYLGVDTLSSGVFRAWFQFYDLGSSSRLALLALAFILIVHFGERWLRGAKKFDLSGHRSVKPPARLPVWGTLLAMGFLSLPLVFGFGLPAFTMFKQALFWLARNPLDAELLQTIGNSLLLVGAAGLVVVVSGLVIAYVNFLLRNPWFAGLARIAATGYAVPGAVIALGTMQIAGLLDHWGVGLGFAWSGSLAILILAYHCRFFSVVYNPLTSAFQQRSRHLHEAGQLANLNRGQILAKVHLPLVWPVLLSGLLLGFLDMLKELPMTMVLRSFDFPTLAVRTYELASNEMMAEASVSASLLILLSLAILMAYLGLQKKIQTFKTGADPK